MRSKKGFTLIEFTIAAAIVAVLASIGLGGYQSHIQNTNFNLMREAASKFALKQQQHRQTFGQYASKVQTQGKASATTLIFPQASDFKTTILSSDFRSFSASLEPKSTSFALKKNCQTLHVQSRQGYLSFTSIDANKQDSSNACLPRG